MFRLTPLLLTIPIVLSLGNIAPAKADCTRYKGWKDGMYGWWSDCTETNRSYDDSDFRLNRRSGDGYYPRLRRHRDSRDRNNRWNSRYDRDWRDSESRRNRDYDRDWRDNNNRRNRDYNDDWRYDKNPDLRIFLGF
jgi:hypothetical protein